MIPGCIADDITCATDLANTLTRQCMHTVQMTGVPKGSSPQADAIVVALKSRTVAPAEACAGLALVTGGPGAAMGLPENLRRMGLLPGRDAAMPLLGVGR